MTDKFKRRVRDRMALTGESYSEAHRHLHKLTAAEPRGEAAAPVDPLWSHLITNADEARDLIELALKIEPRLTAHGVGNYDDPHGPTDAGRAELRNCLIEVAAAADWVKRQTPSKRFNMRHNSYGFKHSVERWFVGRSAPRHVYVSNGALIAAALGLGYEAQIVAPNARFRFSDRTLEAPGRVLHAFLHIVRPDGTQEIITLRSVMDGARVARAFLATQPLETTASGLIGESPVQAGPISTGYLVGIANGEWILTPDGVKEVGVDGVVNPRRTVAAPPWRRARG